MVIIQRLVAIIIDFSVSFTVAFTLAAFISNEIVLSDSEFGGVAFALFLFLFFLKDALFRWGSFGKLLVGVSITSTVDSDQPVNILRRIARNVTLLIWPVDIVFLIVKHERLGDKIAGTQVARRNVPNRMPKGAGVGRRILADIIDWFLCSIEAIVLMSLVFIVFGQTIFDGDNVLIVCLVFFVLILLKDILFHGTSPGKRWLSLRLVSIKGDEDKISLARHMKRNFLIIIAVVEGLMLLMHRYRIGDIITDTKVVDARSDITKY